MARYSRRTVMVMGTLLWLNGCSRNDGPPPVDEAALAREVRERFETAYGHWLAAADVRVVPVDSALNDVHQRVYDVTLEAVLQADVEEALAQLPPTPENRAERLRLEGLRRLDALKPGQKIVARLRALMVYSPDRARWQLEALVRRSVAAGMAGG